MTESEANFPYLPHTDAERKEMLKTIGVGSFDELVKHIPEKLRAKALNLRSGMSEQELAKEVRRYPIAIRLLQGKPASWAAVRIADMYRLLSETFCRAANSPLLIPRTNRK